MKTWSFAALKECPKNLSVKSSCPAESLKYPLSARHVDSLITHEMRYEDLNYVVENDAVFKYIPDMTIDEVIQKHSPDNFILKR